jgi:hypothetical protein
MRGAIRGGTLLIAGLLAGAWNLAPRPCGAASAADRLPEWLHEMTLDAFFATSYSYNFNRPTSATNQLRVFDFDDNTFKLDEFELVAQHAAAKPRDSGFRVDLTLGGSEPRIAASFGLFRDDSGRAGDIDVHQAFASYVAPLGSGLRIDAGKFITGHGYEVIDGYDGWNDNATRSLLFGYAIPFTHVGVRASYTVSPRVSGVVMVVNGWDVARDNNRSKSVGAQLTLTPLASLSLTLSGMVGPERAGNDADPRSLLDLVAILKPNGRLTLGANADWGVETNAAGPGQDGRWSGIAGYARIAMTGGFTLSLRGESFDDPDGVRTGVAQTVGELTATPELRLTPHFLVRGDVRVDRSNRRVFETSGGFIRTQPTVLIEAIHAF